jgi:hypothetical protein
MSRRIPVVPLQADRRKDRHTDMTKMIVDLRTVANPPNNNDFFSFMALIGFVVTTKSVQQNAVVISER